MKYNNNQNSSIWKEMFWIYFGVRDVESSFLSHVVILQKTRYAWSGEGVHKGTYYTSFHNNPYNPYQEDQ